MSNEIDIDNEMAIANTWRPYDFLKFIERELGLRGISHQIFDLKADLGAIKVCLKYVEKVGRRPSSFVKYCLWLFDGLDMKEITSLGFLPQSLRHFYGQAKETPEAKKIVEKHTKKIDDTAKSWLDGIRGKYQGGQ